MINRLLAKGLLVVGKALLRFLPSVSIQQRQKDEETFDILEAFGVSFEELGLLVGAAYSVMFTKEFQALSQESQRKFCGAMTEILGLFTDEDDDDHNKDDESDPSPNDGPGAVEMAEEILRLARV